jgi:16S rRNA (guanine527-N7)-methyltransferase
VTIEALLRSGCAELGIALDDRKCELLLGYLALLRRWNRSYNLTAVRGAEEMVVRHLLDSLSVLPYISANTLLDVGAGAGLPGIPLAIADPARQVTLLDSNGKKTRFMFQAISELGLDNCTVVKARLPHWEARAPFEGVVSRAFASLGDMVDTCGHLLAPDGRLYAMKGALDDAELAAVAGRATVCEVIPLTVPDLDEARCLVVLRPAASAPA